MYGETRSESGGVLLVESVSSIPKSLKQIQKIKERSRRKRDPLVATKTTHKDELYAVMLKCVEDKLDIKEQSRFIFFMFKGHHNPSCFWLMSANLTK